MKKLTLLLAIVTVSGLQAQVIINAQLPATGLTLKSQLWNLSIVNTSGQSEQVQIEVLVTDPRSNQKVFTASTRVFSLQKGMKQFSQTDLLPLTYNVLDPAYNINNSPDGFMPIGAFNICYTVFRVPVNHLETLAEDCEVTEVEPLMPPQLIQPADSDEVDPARPLFTWLPPAPGNLFNNLTYNFQLVEVFPTQSAAEAVEQNIPIHTQQNLFVTNLQYPVALPELDTGKIYAWRVTASSAGNPVAESETWSFTVKKNRHDSTHNYSMKYYARIKAFADASFLVSDGDLKFEYVNKYNEHNVGVRLFDITKAKRSEVTLDSASINIQYGQNLVQLNLAESGYLTSTHIYLLELTNARREKGYLKFEYLK